MLHLFYCMLVLHAILDFPLQGDTVATNKNPDANTPLQKHVPWYYWMASHALAHGGAVALVTGSVFLGMAETIAHFLIDFGKCKKLFSIHTDQLMHIVCKIIWAFVYSHGLK